MPRRLAYTACFVRASGEIEWRSLGDLVGKSDVEFCDLGRRCAKKTTIRRPSYLVVAPSAGIANAQPCRPNHRFDRPAAFRRAIE